MSFGVIMFCCTQRNPHDGPVPAHLDGKSKENQQQFREERIESHSRTKLTKDGKGTEMGTQTAHVLTCIFFLHFACSCSFCFSIFVVHSTPVQASSLNWASLVSDALAMVADESPKTDERRSNNFPLPGNKRRATGLPGGRHPPPPQVRAAGYHCWVPAGGTAAWAAWGWR